jgi:hypothetical protein
MRLLLVLLLLTTKTLWASAGMQLYGMEDFSNTEQQKLNQWLQQSFAATDQLLGPYRFPTEVYLSHQSASEPVPWAYTSRMHQQQVYFQVDTRFSLSDFQQDWTAAHEFSHLALPLLDRDDLWFAEGFASFMQYQVLQHQQLLTESAAWWYRQKLQQLAPLLMASDRPLIPQLKLWLQQKHYKAAYWGSALFFIEANQLVQQQGLSLTGLIQSYQRQNRLTDQNLEQLVRSLDALLEIPVFAPLLLKYQQQSSQQLWRKHPAYFPLATETTT